MNVGGQPWAESGPTQAATELGRQLAIKLARGPALRRAAVEIGHQQRAVSADLGREDSFPGSPFRSDPEQVQMGPVRKGQAGYPLAPLIPGQRASTAERPAGGPEPLVLRRVVTLRVGLYLDLLWSLVGEHADIADPQAVG